MANDDIVMVLLQHYSNVLFATNFGINFILYCISGQNFRKALHTLFCPNRVRRKQEHTQATGEYYEIATFTFIYSFFLFGIFPLQDVKWGKRTRKGKWQTDVLIKISHYMLVLSLCLYFPIHWILLTASLLVTSVSFLQLLLYVFWVKNFTKLQWAVMGIYTFLRLRELENFSAGYSRWPCQVQNPEDETGNQTFPLNTF